MPKHDPRFICAECSSLTDGLSRKPFGLPTTLSLLGLGVVSTLWGFFAPVIYGATLIVLGLGLVLTALLLDRVRVYLTARVCSVCLSSRIVPRTTPVGVWLHRRVAEEAAAQQAREEAEAPSPPASPPQAE